ncbi:MAG: HIT domain-containing protein [Candidatus Cloacimonetes bacterium]|nr:HIT domain-containing protein [Candidatus Cloacimonadota bacterium]
MSEEKHYLYSPWRLDYILTEKDGSCFLCDHQNPEQDRDKLILYRSKHSFVIMNRYPYNNGHIMLCPYEHKCCLASLKDEVRQDLISMLAACEQAIKNVYQCDGINIGLNEGKAAGAGLDEHLHFHIVPRWFGDNSFMTVVASERVIPESFERSYDRISAELRSLLSERD